MKLRRKASPLEALIVLVLIILALTIPVGRTLSSVYAQSPNGGQYAYITTATTTVVRNGFGYLNLVSVNGGTGGTVTLYDVASSGCTGTPASGKFATIASTSTPVSMFYEISVKNGLCVVTAAATDVTVSYN